jgi:hypothetical protein
MNTWVTEVRSDGIPAVRCVNPLEVCGDLVKSLVPSDALPALRSSAYGILEPVFVVVDVLEGNGFRTDIPSAERIVFVSADVKTPFAPDRDLDAADRFAEIAVAIMERTIVGVHGVTALGIATDYTAQLSRNQKKEHVNTESTEGATEGSQGSREAAQPWLV